MPKRDRFGELLVQLEHLRDRAGDLRNFERVCEARAVMIPSGREKHLRLVLEPAERLRMDDAIAVALKRRTDVVFGLVTQPPARFRALRRLRRKNRALSRFEMFSDASHKFQTALKGCATGWHLARTSVAQGFSPVEYRQENLFRLPSAQSRNYPRSSVRDPQRSFASRA